MSRGASQYPCPNIGVLVTLAPYIECTTKARSGCCDPQPQIQATDYRNPVRSQSSRDCRTLSMSCWQANSQEVVNPLESSSMLHRLHLYMLDLLEACGADTPQGISSRCQ
eukprot:7310391-Karenia_brevis.AAC.1